jgi:hypothetical protein
MASNRENKKMKVAYWAFGACAWAMPIHLRTQKDLSANHGKQVYKPESLQ